MYLRRSRSLNLILDWTVLWQDARLRSHLIIAQPGCIDKLLLISVNVCPLISDFPMRWAIYCLQNVIEYFPQIPLCTVNQMECINTANISSDCLPPCSGSILTSFSKSINGKNLLSILSREIDAYRKYTKWSQFPSDLKGYDVLCSK